jgi:hypothetical protein
MDDLPPAVTRHGGEGPPSTDVVVTIDPGLSAASRFIPIPRAYRQSASPATKRSRQDVEDDPARRNYDLSDFYQAL